MKRLRNHLVGIEQGDVNLFSDFEDGGAMWTGDGPRAFEKPVLFSESFRSAPSVHLGMSMWDISIDAHNRADVRAEAVTEEGFTIAFRTWGDTKVARIRVNWIAFGELRHADDWDIY